MKKIFKQLLRNLYSCVYNFLSKTISMQRPSCCHVMALCHEDKQIFYFQCKHGTYFAAGMKFKYCNDIKLSKKMHQEYQIHYAETLQTGASFIFTFHKYKI